MTTYWAYYAPNIPIKEKATSKAQNMIDFFILRGKPLAAGLAKHAPIKEGGGFLTYIAY